MDSSGVAYVVGLIIGWAVGIGVLALVGFWVVRGAILSALAEDRRRVADERLMLAMEQEKEARKAAKKAAKRAVE